MVACALKNRSKLNDEDNKRIMDQIATGIKNNFWLPGYFAGNYRVAFILKHR